MPSWELAQKLRASVVYNGEARKRDSDLIIEETWDEDIATRDMYFYDWYHDFYKTKLNDLNPIDDENKIKMRCKFIRAASKTYAKDPVTYHLQLKPSQQNVVPYYDDVFKNRYGAMYPVGLYVDIPDANGIFNKWLVVGEANVNDPQFPTYELLRCDYVVQYIFKGNKYNVSGVLRSQNSYNSGVWTDYVFTTVQDQQQFVVPINRDTENIFYNQRIIIDNKVLSEPRAWKVTKINRIQNNGLILATLAQDQFDEHKDYVEIGEDGNIIGMWADYFKSSVEPVYPDDSEHKDTYAVISYSGIKPEIKIGGSYKKFTVNFYNEDSEEIDYIDGTWKFEIYDDNKVPHTATNEIKILTHEDSSDVDINQIKVKFVGGNEFIRDVLRVSYTSSIGDISSFVDVEITSL